LPVSRIFLRIFQSLPCVTYGLFYKKRKDVGVARKKVRLVPLLLHANASSPNKGVHEKLVLLSMDVRLFFFISAWDTLVHAQPQRE
jgi:hypothetical protein